MEKIVTYKDDAGEVVNEKKHYYPNRFDDEKGFLLLIKGGSFRQFIQIPFPAEMTDAEIGKLMRLGKHMWRDTNMLGFRGHGGIKPYDIQSMAKLLERTVEKDGKQEIEPISIRHMERFIKKMIDLGVMAKARVETGGIIEVQYYINPLYVFGGNRISNNLYILFHASLDKYIPEWARRKFIGDSNTFKGVFNRYDKKDSKKR